MTAFPNLLCTHHFPRKSSHLSNFLSPCSPPATPAVFSGGRPTHTLTFSLSHRVPSTPTSSALSTLRTCAELSQRAPGTPASHCLPGSGHATSQVDRCSNLPAASPRFAPGAYSEQMAVFGRLAKFCHPTVQKSLVVPTALSAAARALAMAFGASASPMPFNSWISSSAASPPTESASAPLASSGTAHEPRPLQPLDLEGRCAFGLGSSPSPAPAPAGHGSLLF